MQVDFAVARRTSSPSSNAAQGVFLGLPLHRVSAHTRTQKISSEKEAEIPKQYLISNC